MQNQLVNMSLLNEISTKPISIWPPFSNKEFTSTINKYSNISASSLNKISCKYLKAIVKDDECLENTINIARASIKLGHWLTHFKLLLSIIISKSNKTSYDFPKYFYPIVLLNTLGKLIEKVIDKYLQFYSIANDFVHLNQLEELK